MFYIVYLKLHEGKFLCGKLKSVSIQAGFLLEAGCIL